MGNIKGVCSLIAIFLLPAGMLVGMSYLGIGHPLENKALHEEWPFLKTSENEIEVIFFGYAGCSFICPDALMTLGAALDEIHSDQQTKEVGGLFIDVNATLQLDRAEKFAHFFSTHIRGINTKQTSLDKLKDEFRLRIKEDPRGEGALYHTDHFFVLKRTNNKWSIARVVSGDTSKDQLKLIINQQLNSGVYAAANRTK